MGGAPEVDQVNAGRQRKPAVGKLVGVDECLDLLLNFWILLCPERERLEICRNFRLLAMLYGR